MRDEEFFSDDDRRKLAAIESEEDCFKSSLLRLRTPFLNNTCLTASHDEVWRRGCVCVCGGGAKVCGGDGVETAPSPRFSFVFFFVAPRARVRTRGPLPKNKKSLIFLPKMAHKRRMKVANESANI